MKHLDPASTVDLIVENNEEILLVKRKNEPFKNYWALPGGFIEYGKESLEEAAVRELHEETSLISSVNNLQLIGVYSHPNRDPRGHIISHVYHVSFYSGLIKAGDDALRVKKFPINNLPKLAFDHEKILHDYIKWRNKNAK